MKRQIRDQIAGEDQTTPSWSIKEDDRARQESRADQADGYYFVWVLIFAVLPPLASFAWRLVT
ncbi:hypothetical protein [Brevundimonas sp. SL130]|uniref:hypothetical protein n=1 Tax=Brevundimonas sp. SL130 TaxID=2995143 RepID=UPI00226CE8CA|nr:hypothetical protein [Brevundimonas sp. SL130]WAC60212.1 hypothetical protein OU998_01845 [Brevundimonas sp. SL130]